MHFIQVIANQQGKSGKISRKDLQEYTNRITKGWKGDEAQMFVCLWFVLPGDLYEDNAGPYRTEQKLKEATIDVQSCQRLVQGAAKFDWSKVQETPIEQTVNSWWSANESEFSDRCKKYEGTYLESRMN